MGMTTIFVLLSVCCCVGYAVFGLDLEFFSDIFFILSMSSVSCMIMIGLLTLLKIDDV